MKSIVKAKFLNGHEFQAEVPAADVEDFRTRLKDAESDGSRIDTATIRIEAIEETPAPMSLEQKVDAILIALNKMQMDGHYNMPAETDRAIQALLQERRQQAAAAASSEAEQGE